MFMGELSPEVSCPVTDRLMQLFYSTRSIIVMSESHANEAELYRLLRENPMLDPQCLCVVTVLCGVLTDAEWTFRALLSH